MTPDPSMAASRTLTISYVPKYPSSCYGRNGMLDETQQQAIVTRLNRIEGQVRGIRRMVQEPRLCIEILQQLAAAEAALNRISLAVFRFHVEKCVPEGISKGDPDRSQRLSELVDIFDRFAK